MMGLDRIEADGPLERTAARSIPKPCLEAGHRIVPTCQPVHVGSDRTDRSSVLFLDSIPSDGRFLAGGFNPWRVSRNSPGRHSAGLLGELFAKRSEALLSERIRSVMLSPKTGRVKERVIADRQWTPG